MNATIDTATQVSGIRTGSSLMAIIGAAAIGISILAAAGYVQASALHDGAHDSRHATGFPCH